MESKWTEGYFNTKNGTITIALKQIIAGLNKAVEHQTKQMKGVVESYKQIIEVKTTELKNKQELEKIKAEKEKEKNE